MFLASYHVTPYLLLTEINLTQGQPSKGEAHEKDQKQNQQEGTASGNQREGANHLLQGHG
mgnify:CR=1 FL=1